MIITKLSGGLGNQMFQYAVGRALSIHHNASLLLDISSYNDDILRNYNLYPFNIVENIAKSAELNRVILKEDLNVRFIIKSLNLLLTKQKPIFIINEKFFHFDPEILNLPDNVYLNGYWQTPLYFKKYEQAIRNDFTFKLNPDKLNQKIGTQITRENSISLHIRRGDYLTNPQANTRHYVCERAYYQKALESALENISDPHIFVFSDDPIWAKENIFSSAPITFVSHNSDLKNYEDLRLITLCKHHIIANSTFSWWGAWLSQNKSKIVYYPGYWFKNDYNTKDLFPSIWKKIL